MAMGGDAPLALIDKSRIAGPEAVKDSEGYYLKGLSADFRDQADVELVLEGKHTLPCHSAILRLHSTVFDVLLRKDAFDGSTSKQAERVRLRLPMIGESLSAVMQLLTSIYSPKKLHINSIVEAETLLDLAHKYDMPRLMEGAKEYLLPGLVPKEEVSPNTVVRDVSAALAWLQHCQRYGISDCVNECELEIGRHYLELIKDRQNDLAVLSSSSLIRISEAYALCLAKTMYGARTHDAVSVDATMMHSLKIPM